MARRVGAGRRRGLGGDRMGYRSVDFEVNVADLKTGQIFCIDHHPHAEITPGSRLLVRLHRFELESRYPAQVSIEAVDQVICVSRHYAQLCRERTGWPEPKVATVPNAIDVAQLDRPKLDGARLHLGLVGIELADPVLDLALLLAEPVQDLALLLSHVGQLARLT